jgi:FAD/FMN-containing dehydrogenase
MSVSENGSDAGHNVSRETIDVLRTIVGEDNLTIEAGDREFISTDLSWLSREVSEASVRPGTIDELSKVVRAATGAGFSVVPRGGGMSYTQGYTPSEKMSVSLDTERLGRIVEINEDDMYVVVECGCTWKKLYEALQEKGLRTPYYGPLSGRHATVGGALSQNSLFLGSGIHHTAAESVLGLEVVLADGTLLRTGGWAHKNGTPFFRNFGPDLTGLFTADTGAMAVKSRAALRLIKTPPSTAIMSFGFETLEQMLSAQVEIARLSIASECYGFDPYYNANFEKLGFTLTEGLATVGKIAAGAGSWWQGIKRAVAVAFAGRAVLRDVNYSLHMTLDAIDDAAANSSLQAARKICLAHTGQELVASLPAAFRAEPFQPVRTLILGSDGECWIPIHGFVPLSKAVPVAQEIEGFFAENKELMDRHGIRTSYLTCFSGAEFLIEPSFYWYDELGPYRLSRIESEFQEKWQSRKPDTETRDVVLGLREGLRDIFFKHGACHLQIGKYYPYKDALVGGPGEPYWDLLTDIKRLIDPDKRVNPGSLGL